MLGRQKSNVSLESMARAALLVRRQEGGGASRAMTGVACPHVVFGTEAWGPFHWGELHSESGGMPFTLDISKPISHP